MWGILLSGFLGAFLATLLSIIYLYISGQRKLRMEVLMDVVGFWDDIFDRFLIYHSSYGPVAEFLEKERHDAYRKVFGQLYSESLRTKLEFVYGKGNALRIFDELRDEFKIKAEVSVVFHIAKKETLKKSSNVFLEEFKQKVEPLRKSLRDSLLQETSVASIIHQAIESGKNFILKCKQS